MVHQMQFQHNQALNDIVHQVTTIPSRREEGAAMRRSMQELGLEQVSAGRGGCRAYLIPALQQ
jgi:hypothetical protein